MTKRDGVKKESEDERWNKRNRKKGKEGREGCERGI